MARQRSVGWIILFALLGAGVAGYLTYHHFALFSGNIKQGLACSFGRAFNCDVVALSPFSHWGPVPVALIGAVMYGWMIALGCLALGREGGLRRAALQVIVGMAAVALLVDGYLGWMMFSRVRYWCALCLITYLINIGVFLAAQGAIGEEWNAVLLRGWRTLGDLNPIGRPAALVPVTLLGGWLMTLALLGAGTALVSQKLAPTFTAAEAERLRQAIRGRPLQPLDASGDPSKGAATPLVQVAEFSDFQCPACQRAATTIQLVAKSVGPEVSWVFKNYPLDQSCNSNSQRTMHPLACKLAIAGECAQQQGKFWAFHDRVFIHGPQYKEDWLKDDAASAGLELNAFEQCLASPAARDAVLRDIAQAANLGVQSTPTFVVNGIPFSGIPPAQTLIGTINVFVEEAARGKQ